MNGEGDGMLKLLGDPVEPVVEPKYTRPAFTDVRRGLVGFKFNGEHWFSSPYLTFKPRGLLIWDAPPRSTIECHIVGRLEILFSFEPVPARWFATGKSFEQLAQELTDGKEPSWWCTFQAVCPGQQIRLTLLDADRVPVSNAVLVMWGHALQ